MDCYWPTTRRRNWYFSGLCYVFHHIFFIGFGYDIINVAKEYQIKYSEVFDNLLDSNFDSKPVQFGDQDVIDGGMQPLQSGNKQRVTLVLPKSSENVTYYIALRAVNDNNDASSTSNVVSVKLAVIKQPPTEPPNDIITTTSKSSMETTAIANISSTQTTTTWSPQTTTKAGISCKSH